VKGVEGSIGGLVRDTILDISLGHTEGNHKWEHNVNKYSVTMSSDVNSFIFMATSFDPIIRSSLGHDTRI